VTAKTDLGRSGAEAPSGLRPSGGAAKASPAEPLVPNAGSFGNSLANTTERLLLSELRSGKGTTRSLGVLYGLLMGAARAEDHMVCAFRTVNRAIQDYYGDGPVGRLDRIKKVAWDFFERAASAGEAGTAATAKTDAVHEHATREAGDAQ
jgi:hypothetical protein